MFTFDFSDVVRRLSESMDTPLLPQDYHHILQTGQGIPNTVG